MLNIQLLHLMENIGKLYYGEVYGMRYLLTKSKQVIIINMFISILIVLCFANLVEAFNMTGKYADNLSESYLKFSIISDKDKEGNEQKLSDLIKRLNNENKDYYLHKEAESNIVGIYSNNKSFTPKLISGRGFEKNDFLNKTNTILVSEDILKECYIVDNKQFYVYNNLIYEVIGIYKRSNNKVNIDAKAYYNLNSRNITDSANFIVGTYSYDSEAEVNISDNLNDLEYKIIEHNNTLLNRIGKAISSQEASVYSIILVIIMVIINSINISSSWIDSRKKELFVRIICGATDEKIKMLLYKDYILILTIAFFPALIISYMLTFIDLDIFIGFDFSIYTVLFSYFIVLIIGLITNQIMLKIYKKSKISSVMR